MDLQQYQERYAEVLVKIGVQLKEGQTLCVEAPIEQQQFVALLAQAAYRAGCGEFGVIWHWDALDRLGLEQGLPFQNGADLAAADYYAAKGGAILYLDSPDLSAFAGIAAPQMAQRAAAIKNIRNTFRQKAPGCGLTLACLPSQPWADLVFPDVPPQQRLEALWDAVLLCARCKAPDPIVAWQEYIRFTAKRKQILDSKGYTAFHFHGGGNEATFAPAEGEKWKGGCMETESRVWSPNIPTEEIFIAPHKYRAEGKLVSSLPLNHKGGLIEGIELTLREGRIVDYRARKGQDLLEQIIETDEGSHYLGEMALVAQDSPIAGLGRVFYTTLYDENAACHVAIGDALGLIQDPERREAMGLNTSAVHVDFMIGSSQLCVEGKLPDGTWQPILQNGLWALDEMKGEPQ
ncbi:MAG: aminopeptidase [Clostridiaceae bacterium]|jgi:aminopeptidase|nr:aminopeptidase [Clostridiaceae bacterium]